MCLIKLTKTIWIGDSASWTVAEELGIKTVLNVAQDMRCQIGWPDVEYMQVGLVDGPGNTATVYYSAVLALADLQRRGSTLVMCHTGGRSLAVCLLYMNVFAKCGWDKCVEMLRERLDDELPVPHTAHKEVFEKINWKLLERMIK